MSEGSDIVHTYKPDGSTSFVMVIAREGEQTIDGREFGAGSITWREPPISLMYLRDNDPTGRGGHKSSHAVAAITDIWREDNEEGFGTIYGKGHFATDEVGQEARDLIAQGVISGVSADVGGAITEELVADEEFGMRKIIRQGTIVAVTALPIPAFNDTKISVDADGEPPLLASATPEWKPEAVWFENPNLTEPTPVTVTADGRVYGHAALWGTCHIGYKDRCVTPPHSKSNYQYFNVGNVLTADGKTINVGRLTAGTNHARIEFGAQPAVDHYDHTGWAAAYVHTGEDSHGIWFAGTLSPTATQEQIAVLRASSVSGDWRAINNSLELVGVLAVNTPGFPIPRARAGIVAGAQVSLIASGLCGCENEELSEEQPTEIVQVEEVVETPAITNAARLRLLDLDMDMEFTMGSKKCKGDCGCKKCGGKY